VSEYALVIPRYVCWATGPLNRRVPTVLRARTAADAVVQAELLLRDQPWTLSQIEPFEEDRHRELVHLFPEAPWWPARGRSPDHTT